MENEHTLEHYHVPPVRFSSRVTSASAGTAELGDAAIISLIVIRVIHTDDLFSQASLSHVTLHSPSDADGD